MRPISSLSLYLLGEARAVINGQPLQVDTRKAIALLAYLALNPVHPGRDALAALFWPEVDETRARAALRRTLSVLRSALGAANLDTSADSVALRPGALAYLDVVEFRRRAAPASHPHSPDQPCQACLQDLAQAAALYHGDFMAGFGLRDSPAFDNWQFFEAEALRSELASVLQRLAAGLSARGDFEAAAVHARRWLALDPLREEVHGLLMKIYTWGGQRGAALRQYRECVRILESELGVQPLEETTQLYTLILENRLELPVPVPVEKQELPSVESMAFPAALAFDLAHVPLVGRGAELAQMQNAYAASSAQGAVFVLEGEAGIGKTRLANEFLAFARQRGAQVLAARCYEGEARLPYAPFLDILRNILADEPLRRQLSGAAAPWLSEAARLLPEINLLFPDLPPAPALDGPGAQARFFEGLRQVLLTACQAARPGVLYLDDVHWADPATLDLLSYLVRRVQAHPLFVLLTWHSTEISPDHPLRRMLLDAQRTGQGTALELGRLTQPAIEELVSAAYKLGLSLPGDTPQRLYQESEGLPFIAVEFLGSLAKGETQLDAQGWALPERVRLLLRSRLHEVDETSRQLLTAAAVIGRSFDLETLRQASGRSELETVGSLEVLCARGLVQEAVGGDLPPSPAYDFSHDKLRTVVYEEVGLARRRLLHRRVAEALQRPGRTAGEARQDTGLLAYHYHMAGLEAEAAEHYFQAGEQARALYANSLARSYFQSALALGHPQAASIHTALGDLHTLAADYPAALTSYETAASLVGEGAQLARLEMRLGEVCQRLGDWDRSACHFAEADASLPVADASGRAGLFAMWSLSLYHQADFERAQSLAEQSLLLARQAGDPLPLAQAYNALGRLARRQGDGAAALAYLDESLDAARRAADPGAQIASLNNRARLLAEAGDPLGALFAVDTALEICQRLGDRHHQAALLNNMADYLHAAGRQEQALAVLKQAVAIFAEIGLKENGLPAHPEIWKLAEW